MKKALSRIDVTVLILSNSSDRTVPAYLTDELEGGLSHVKRVVFKHATATWDTFDKRGRRSTSR